MHLGALRCFKASISSFRKSLMILALGSYHNYHHISARCKIWNLRVPGSNHTGGLFVKISFFHGKTWINTFFIKTLLWILIGFSQVLDKSSYFWIQLKKRDFLQNVCLQMIFFLKNAVSEKLNKLIYRVSPKNDTQLCYRINQVPLNIHECYLYHYLEQTFLHMPVKF